MPDEISLTDERPCEFGVKASIVTANRRAPGGQFVLHAQALPGNLDSGAKCNALKRSGFERRFQARQSRLGMAS
jgi:hypothetical protein